MLDDLVSDYFNREHVKEIHSERLLNALMEYWARERDYQIESKLLKDLVLKYSSAERKLDLLNRMKNRFLSFAAHDLRNPLVSIRGLSEILLEELRGNLNAHQKDYLTTIFIAADTTLALVNGILDISAIESGGIELYVQPNSLKRVLTERLKIHKILAEKKDILLRHRLSELPDFPFDRSRVAQIIDNLIGNAIKFTAPGKQIHVSLRRQEAMAKVSVRDEGPGIRKEDFSKVFGEYQKLGTKTTGGETSTGLGLAIAKKLVQQMSGTIEVESVVGAGTTFSFKIPMTDPREMGNGGN
jgi:two-component system, sensor histidine kinase and response regulator